MVTKNPCISCSMTIPVSVAGGERSFSKLSLVKSCLRSTMLQERLTPLVMLSAERELAKTLDYNDIINTFAVQKSRKAFCNYNIRYIAS